MERILESQMISANIKWLRSRWLEITLCLIVFAGMVWTTSWGEIVHGGDQLSIRMLAKELFSEFFNTKEVTAHFDWGGLHRPDDNYPPLPIILWAFLWKITGWENSFLVFNAMIWSIQVFLWSSISRKLTGYALAGILTFATFSTSFRIMNCVTTGLKEPLYLFFLLLFLKHIISASAKSEFALAGAFLGLSYLTRYNTLTIVPVVALFILFPLCKKTVWKNAHSSICLLVGFFAVIFPWMVRNWLTLGGPFDYLMTKYAFGWTWTDFTYYSDFPPTTADLFSHFGPMIVLKKICMIWGGNLLKFIKMSYAHWIIALSGILVFSSVKNTNVQKKGALWVFILMVSLLPSIFIVFRERWILLPYIFLFFLACVVFFSLILKPENPGDELKPYIFVLLCSFHLVLFAYILFSERWRGITYIFLFLLPFAGAFLLVFKLKFMDKKTEIMGLLCGFQLIMFAYRFPGLNNLFHSDIFAGFLFIAALIAISGAIAIPSKELMGRSLVRRILLITLLVIFTLPNARSATTNVQRHLSNKKDGIYLMHRELGQVLRSIAKPNDVVSMYYPMIAWYYADLPSVQLPVELRKDQFERIISHYRVTLVVDYMQPENFYQIIPDKLIPVAKIEGRGSYSRPLTIYRVPEVQGSEPT